MARLHFPRLAIIALLPLSASALFIASTSAQTSAPKDAGGKQVTPENYIRAETDRTFYSISQQAGGINRFFYYRKVTPLDNQTVVRMNKDTLYAGAIIDTSKGATITVPKMPPKRYFSVLLLDNDHYFLGTIYTAGTHKLPQETKYIAALLRIQLLHPDDPADVALVNKLQDEFVVHANSADPFPKPMWDTPSLDALRAKYNADFAKYDRYPDGFMAPRGQADENIRQDAAAGAWGLFPNKDATYINYNGQSSSGQCYTATYHVPDNKGLWSITVYGSDGYIKTTDSVLNAINTKMNADGTFTAYFGSEALCGKVANRLDAPDGWNFLMRIYRPGQSVLDGSYKLPEVRPVAKASP